MGSRPRRDLFRKQFITVEFEVDALLVAKGSNVALCVNSPSRQHFRSQARRPQNLAITCKAYVQSIKEMIDMRGKQQTIVPIQLFPVVRQPPWFDMTGNKVLWPLDSCHPAPSFDQLDT